MSPDTSNPRYNKLVRLPNFADWNTILTGVNSAVQPFITEFIARYQADHDMTDTTPYLKIEVGYLPYSTLKVDDVD